MPTEIEIKVADPEAELSSAQRTHKELAPLCSVAKRAAGIPQLAPQEKQMGILKHEMDETLLCIKLASKGRHALHDATVKSGIRKAIVEYDSLENAELAHLENAYNNLRRMENRLDLAIKQFCIVNTDNKKIREEINTLLVERDNFNVLWHRAINKLVKGKSYLMDVLEVATITFAQRDEWSRSLEVLKEKGLYGLNKDINEMRYFDEEINHLAKLEEFLRVKGTKRYCEADTIAEMKVIEEEARCGQDIEKHDALLDDIFAFAGSDVVADVIKRFNENEVQALSIYMLLCEVLQHSFVLKREVEGLEQKTQDQRDINQSRKENEDLRVASLRTQLDEQRQRNQHLRDLNNAAETKIQSILQGINDIVRIAQCNLTPLMSLLGNHKVVNKWNADRFLRILEVEVKSLVQTAYGMVKSPTPQARRRKAAADSASKKLVADPCVQVLQPNRLEKLVPYQPCAYCVEDFIMSMVLESPAEPADKQYIIDNMFHLQDVNTKFGIFTLTVPEVRLATLGTAVNLYKTCINRTVSISKAIIDRKRHPRVKLGLNN